MTLFKSPVVFNEDKHTYHLGGSLLQGITPVISWLFPDTYKDIDAEVLRQAAAHGKYIHSLCQIFDETGSSTEEHQLQDYIRLTDGYTHIASEYLVSDNQNFASSIDKVYKGSQDNTVVIGDIKCTSALHMMNVTVQLSIYAMLFEQQNPNMKVEKQIVIWLPKPQYGKASISECTRLPDELCREILDAYINAPWESDIMRSKIYKSPSIIQTYGDLPVFVHDVQDEIIRIMLQLKEAKEREEQLKKGLYAKMEEHNAKMFESDKLLLTRVLPTKSETFDSKKLKEEMPEIYAKYVKQTTRAGSLRITIR